MPNRKTIAAPTTDPSDPYDDVPFVPAYDLGEENKELSEYEVTAIALGLYTLASTPAANQVSEWKNDALVEGISRRTLPAVAPAELWRGKPAVAPRDFRN